MRAALSLLLISGLCAVRVHGYARGAPCDAADNMTPNPTYHGKPQDIEKNPPPFKLHVINPEGYVAKQYASGETYTVRISGSTFFRGFLVQARRVVNGRITAERVGHFEEEASWSRVGVQFQECDSNDRNSVTHIDARRKYYLNLKWIPDKKVGPVQFVLSIIQNQTYFWANWLPEKGLLAEASGLNISPPETPPVNNIHPSPDTTKTVVTAVRPLPSTARPETTEAPKPKEKSKEKAAESSLFEQKEGGKGGKSEQNEIGENSDPPQGTKKPSLPRPKPTPARTQAPPTPQFGAYVVPDAAEPAGPAAPAPSTSPELEPVAFKPNIATPRLEGNPYPLGPHGARVHPPPVLSEEVVAVAPFAYVEIVPTQVLLDLPKEEEPEEEKSSEEEEVFIDEKDYGKDFCAAEPCKNGGSCENEPTGFYCICPSGYTGNKCDTYDYCAKSPCTQNGVCQLNQFGFECVCDRGYSGRKCELRCPEYVCKNGGTCFVDNTNSYACKCPPGWTGKSCEKDINECESNPCQNGATCEDRQNNYRCNCHQGFHGKNCQRLCIDIYRSCGNQWKDEDRCETMRYLTRFFEVNCPVACGGCTALDRSLLRTAPLPPKLEPFAFLLGKWIAKVGQKENFPIPMSEPFESVLDFMVTEVPMFGTPAVNYSIVNTDQFNRSVQVVNGFVMLARTRPVTISVSSTGNSGFTLIEEGFLNTTTNRIDLVSVFNSTVPRVKPLFPALIRRSIYPSGNYLTVKHETLDHFGNEASFQHYYTRLENFQPLKAGPVILIES